MSPVSSFLAIVTALVSFQSVAAQACSSLTGWDPSWKLSTYTSTSPTQMNSDTFKNCLKPYNYAGTCMRITNPAQTTMFLMQPDGNAVIYTIWYALNCNLGKGCISPIWYTGSNKANSNIRVIDGKFVISYNTDGSLVAWDAGPRGSFQGTSLCMQNDGNLVLYDNGTPLWASGTLT
ncbi:UNVERIFIED_CONTAM: hypothetical protein HDU68_008178 [Siphonaria sp. JEL0065]|nr:hypothetical protein HDU68_008178 [Siphonaria sp. JEL0065]